MSSTNVTRYLSGASKTGTGVHSSPFLCPNVPKVSYHAVSSAAVHRHTMLGCQLGGLRIVPDEIEHGVMGVAPESSRGLLKVFEIGECGTPLVAILVHDVGVARQTVP